MKTVKGGLRGTVNFSSQTDPRESSKYNRERLINPLPLYTVDRKTRGVAKEYKMGYNARLDSSCFKTLYTSWLLDSAKTVIVLRCPNLK